MFLKASKINAVTDLRKKSVTVKNPLPPVNIIYII
nr:MAG TPA: hypothetical protein [Caudoviricetes sp.]